MLLLTVAGLASTAFHPSDGKTYPRGEFYPLSSYPMYSHFSGRDYYVYLADADGGAVRCKDYGITAPKLKKRFKSDLKAAKLRESELRERRLSPAKLGMVADKVLRWVAKKRRADASLSPGDELTMRMVYIYSESGEIRKEEYRVAGAVLEK